MTVPHPAGGGSPLASPAAARRVPFHRPFLGEIESRAMLDALNAGHLVGNGPVGRRAEAALASVLGVPEVMLTTSCTTAMELAWMAIGIGPGDEVLLPSFTFVSCATSIVRTGATPVFVDIDPLTLMLDPGDLARRTGPRSRAVLCMHYGGMACDMRAIGEIAGRHGLPVVEDAAQGIGARLGTRALGTIGDVGCFSFHGTKNVTCGEGGALVVGRPDLAERALVMREKGTNRRAFLEGRVDKYTWVETGGSFELSDLLAAMLLAQLSRLDVIQAERTRVAERYLDRLSPLADAGRLTLPRWLPDVTPNWHTFHLLLPSAAQRDRVIRGLSDAGIEATFHFVPLHSSPYAQEHYGYRPEDLPVTEDVARRLLRLPIYPDLGVADQQHVIDTLHRLLN